MDKTMRKHISFKTLYHEETVVACEHALIVVFGLCGTSTIHIAQEKCSISEAGVFVINPLTFFRITCPENARVLCLYIDSELIRLAGWNTSSCIACNLSSADVTDSVHIEVRQQYAHLFHLSLEENLPAISSAAIKYVSFLLEHFGISAASKNLHSAGSGEAWTRLLHILRIIQERYADTLSLSALAKENYISSSYLARMFRQHLNTTFNDYLVTVRLEHAAADLIGGTDSITDIAYRNGFKNVNSFITYFKRKYQRTPGQYRKAQTTMRNELQEISEDTSEALQTLLQYIPQISPTKAPAAADKPDPVFVDVSKPGIDFRHTWSRILNIGYAHDGLIAVVQEQILRAAREVGYTELRFHGLFDEDMQMQTQILRVLQCEQFRQNQYQK